MAVMMMAFDPRRENADYRGFESLTSDEFDMEKEQDKCGRHRQTQAGDPESQIGKGKDGGQSSAGSKNLHQVSKWISTQQCFL
jgi:general stress protein YciG